MLMTRIFLAIVLPIILVAIGGFITAWAVILIKRQIKIYHSISLVELKCNKIHYLAFLMVLGFLAFFVFMQMLDPNAPEVSKLSQLYSMSRLETNITLSSVFVLLICVEFLLIVLVNSNGAIVDRGIYTATKFIDWYNIHDYIIDDKKSTVVLSSDKRTFLSIKGMTPQMKIKRNDIAKLKFILNKNKNRFSSRTKSEDIA